MTMEMGDYYCAAVYRRRKFVLVAEEFMRRREKDYWVHPYYAERRDKFIKFYWEIRRFENKFFNYYRMSMKSFDELLKILRPHITKKNTNWRDSISAEERLTITLRFLATGNTFYALQHEFLVSPTTISVIVEETCEAIWDELKPREMPEPTEEKWSEIADIFYAKTQFPNCVGAVDGKHIRCMKPRRSGSLFYNYKKYFSVVLMALVDANCCFIAIDVGAYGQEGDSTVFRDSTLGQKLYSGQLNLPLPKCLPNTDSEPQPFVIVGDEAFKLHTNLLRPFPSRNLDARKRIFNYRLSRCRRNVECGFGILANKWGIFHTSIRVLPTKIDKIIKACCVLHNYVRRRDGINYDDGETYPATMEDIQDAGLGCVTQQGLQTREFFASYFVGPGAVSFQSNYNY